MNTFDKRSKATMGIAAVLIALAGISMYRSFIRPRESHAVASYYDRVADQVGQASACLKKNSDIVVLVFDSEMRSMNNEPLKRMIKALKENDLSIRHVEQLVMDPDNGWSSTISGFPYREYLRVARKFPKAGAIVSLCGAPYLQPGTERPDPTTLPPLAILRAVQKSEQLNRLLDEGRVSMAVVYREVEPGEEAGGDASDFEQTYAVLTAKSVKIP